MQANLNHCRGAQQLLQHYMCETSSGLCCVSEPWLVLEDHRWFASENERAVLVNPDALPGVCTLARKATDFVAVKYKNLHIISVYLSPNVGIRDFEEYCKTLQIS